MIGARGTVTGRMQRWDVATLKWIPWDGALTTGAVTIGQVTLGDITAAKTQLIPISGTASGSGNNSILTPTSGKAINLAYASYNPSAPVECAFRFGTSGQKFLDNNIVAAGSIIAKDFGDFRYVKGAINESLYLNLSSAVPTIWNAFYWES